MLTVTDHMFLVPERALSMDINRLQEDLAGLDFDARLLQVAPMGNVWISGSRPSSAARGGTMHWFAYVGPDPPSHEEDREARIKNLKERQNEERQKKLEEIKVQAMAAQRYKEQRELERRRRMDEMREREDTRRHQVEERKKAINEAERDRLESILRRNQEREARIEARKRNDRSSMVFAFGSSTPRMLEPTDSMGSFWGHRRATSTQNITCTAVPLTRRQSERELDGGSKKRATSAGGLERSGEGTPPQTPAGCASGYVGRRRTDLMPTIPSKESPSSSNRKPFARSPGRAYSMSRLDQLAKPRKRPELLPPVSETSASNASPRPLNHSQQSSVSRSMSHLAVSKHGTPQRPLRKSDSRSMHQLSAAPLPPPRTTRAAQLRQQKLANNTNHTEAPSRPSSSLSQQSTSSVTSSVNMRTRPVAAPRRPRPVSIAVTGVTSNSIGGTPDRKPPLPLPKSRKSSLVKSQEKLKKKPGTAAGVATAAALGSPTDGTPRTLTSPTTNTAPPVVADVKDKLDEIKSEHKSELKTEVKTEVESEAELLQVEVEAKPDPEVATEREIITESNESQATLEIEASNEVQEIPEVPSIPVELVNLETDKSEVKKLDDPVEVPVNTNDDTDNKVLVTEQMSVTKASEIEVSTSARAGTETAIQAVAETREKFVDEPKPNQEEDQDIVDMTASMTKVRITTEEEAKAALAERRRLAREEAERQAEMERMRIEREARLEYEKQQREEEQQRVLIEQMKAAEQERLEEAIKEAQRREEEEKIRKEEENRQRILKEETDRKAREEAEKQKAELQERLKHEEKEREARRKRVEAIMLRTRGKNNSATSQQTEEKNEENNSDKLNGSKSENSENGHKNGKEIETVDNIIPVETLKNANTVNDTLSTDDTLNSNNSWQHNTQTDLLM